MQHILVINGPNLNLLGTREPERYGQDNLDKVLNDLKFEFASDCEIHAFQSASEADLVDRIHQTLSDSTDAIVINPGAFTHTSVAMRDALLSTQTPFVEIHVSNVFQREPFRHRSYFSDLAETVIVGAGTLGYRLAILAAMNRLKQQPKQH